ncbi:MAG: hypothetical protein KAI81_03620 [Candidatus Marinimicrobia bacterium]|nr:hypothetical protein [Candidatus Neomarinimicrobiota bacterium]
MQQNPNAYHAHNLVIQLLTSTGLLGYLAFCWLFVSSCRAIFTDFSGWRAGLFSWPVVFLVSGLVGANIYASDYQPLVAFFLVLIACKQPFSAAGSNRDD